jgi:hypothetical protein
MGFISHSKRFKDQHIERWREVLANFIVDPDDYPVGSVTSPYSKGREGQRRHSGIVLKDAETHKAIMTYASRLVLTVLGDPRGEYIRAQPTGWEDAGPKADTVTKLLRYSFALPGVFRTMVEAVVEMLLFGTAIIEIPWRYQEREQLVRGVQSFDGITTDTFTRQRVVAYDDPTMTVVDHQDFYPDPSQYRIEDMAGVAKGFDINALKAREMAEAGIYTKSGVEEAVAAFGRQSGDSDSDKDTRQERFREGIDLPEYTDEDGDFTPMRGIEYWGEVPWGSNRDQDVERAASRRVVTLLNGIVVRDDPYPLSDPDLPFRALVINPVCGRFYGVSPAEVIRYDQSLQDAIKILLAEAIIRSVHPPIAYDIDSEIDLNKLRRWTPDAPLGIRGGPNAVGTLRYDGNVFNGFQQTAALKQSMQEASGALSVLQGQGLGTSRASATEAGFAAQQSVNRPEMAAVLLERDAMPLIGKSFLRRYQQFLEDDADLARRVGELPQSVWIGDILGDFDIIFSGSRLAMSRQEKLQSYDRLISLAQAIPQAALMLPWFQLLQQITGDTLELPEVASKIGDPQVMQQNALLLGVATQAGGQGGAGNNGVPSRSSPPGQLPAQAGGNSVG